MKNLICLAVLAMMLPGFAGAGAFSSDLRGTSALGFLKTGAGARAAALGGAYTALSGDAASLYWNPAGLLYINHRSITLMRANYVGASNFNYLSFAGKLSAGAAYGVSVTNMSVGPIKETDTLGFESGSMSPGDTAFSFGFAYTLREWGIGAAYKLINSKLKNTASVHALDLGIMSPKYLKERLNFGFSVLNLGGPVKYEVKNEKLPLIIKAGAAYQISTKAGLSADLCFPIDDSPYVTTGAEFEMYSVKKMKFLWRIGFNTGTIGDFGGFNGFSAGIGFVFKTVKVDYAAVPLGPLGLSNRVSLSLDF